jgi:hypothetical protein
MTDENDADGYDAVFQLAGFVVRTKSLNFFRAFCQSWRISGICYNEEGKFVEALACRIGNKSR